VWLKQQGVANICIMTVLNAHALLGVLAANHRYVEANEDTLLSLYI
jgi:PTS system glucose-specific IIA component